MSGCCWGLVVLRDGGDRGCPGGGGCGVFLTGECLRGKDGKGLPVGTRTA